MEHYGTLWDTIEDTTTLLGGEQPGPAVCRLVGIAGAPNHHCLALQATGHSAHQTSITGIRAGLFIPYHALEWGAEEVNPTVMLTM